MSHQKKPAAQHDKPTDETAASEDRLLDEALEESFPASDPIAIGVSEPPHIPEKPEKPAEKKRH